jgi:hypothetical protein
MWIIEQITQHVKCEGDFLVAYTHEIIFASFFFYMCSHLATQVT